MFPLQAGAFVYWVNTGNGTIARANLDGTNVNQSFISGASSPCLAPAVDGDHVYWANGGSNTIGRANLDGTNVNQSFVSGANSPCGVAVNSDHVYWSTGGGVGRANLDGSSPEPNFITLQSSTCNVAVDAAHVYWTTDSATIRRANLTDGLGVTNFIPTASSPCSVTIDSAHFYWTNSGTIGRVDLNGVTNKNTAFLPVNACGLAVDALHIYWAESSGNTIGRVNLDGTGINHSLITGANAPCGVAVDALSSPVVPPPPPDKTAPTLGSLLVSPTAFKAAKSGPSATATTGTRVVYKLSESARTTFSVQRAKRGFKRGRSCVRKRPKGKARRCTRFTDVKGNFARDGQSGLNEFRFTGRLQNRALGRGKYRLVAIAQDAAGNRSKPTRAAFRIVG